MTNFSHRVGDVYARWVEIQPTVRKEMMQTLQGIEQYFHITITEFSTVTGAVSFEAPERILKLKGNSLILHLSKIVDELPHYFHQYPITTNATDGGVFEAVDNYFLNPHPQTTFGELVQDILEHLLFVEMEFYRQFISYKRYKEECLMHKPSSEWQIY